MGSRSILNAGRGPWTGPAATVLGLPGEIMYAAPMDTTTTAAQSTRIAIFKVSFPMPFLVS
jgi:hypothetical protein